MEGDLTWFKFRSKWIKTFKALSKPEMDRLFDAIDAFNNGKELPDMVGRESLVWTLIESELEFDKDARRKAVEAHRTAGSKGGRPKTKINQTEPNETKNNQMVFDETKNNQTKPVKELRVKSIEVNEVKNNICAEAHVSAPEKPKLTPNDHDFWKFAKENAELAEAFYKASGLYPIGNQFGRWVNDLKNFHEAGITVQQMQAAVQKIRREGRITISAPGSVFTTARDIALSGQRSKPYQNQQKQSWDEVAAKVQAEMTCSDAFVFDEVDSEVIDI